MKKVFFVALAAVFLAGCGSSSTQTNDPAQVADASVLASFDGGKTFESRATIDSKTNLAGMDILSWVFHTTNSNIFYVGTLKDGIYRTLNKGEQWEALHFPPEKVYAMAIDPRNGDRLFASGVYEGIAKLYLSDDAGTNWREIYTEPGKGAVITSLAIDPNDGSHVIMGTSTGAILESRDGGTKWNNLKAFEDAVTQLIFIQKAPGTILALKQGKQVVISRDNGASWEEKEQSLLPLPAFSNDNDQAPQSADTGAQNTILADQYVPGLLYTGTNQGLYRSHGYGVTWEALNVLESSKNFPIRAIGVNPKNSREIVYVAGSAFYKSTDNGATWSTVNLPISRTANILEYDPYDPNTLYITLRK